MLGTDIDEPQRKTSDQRASESDATSIANKWKDKPTARGDKDKDKNDENDDAARARRAFVKKWQARIKSAKSKWDDDFTRMRDNMDFCAGLQWQSQKKLTHEQYIVNMTIKTINQRVASLYARNPKVVAKCRPRLDFTLWDGDPESITHAVLQASQLAQAGVPVPPQLMALFTDYQQGMARRKMCAKIGETLSKVYQYQIDEQEPKFKTQMKQLARRVCVTGVGYIKTIFCRDYENELTQSETRINTIDRARRAERILKRMEDGKLQPDQAEFQELKNLLASLHTLPGDYETTRLNEHLVFDFPKATSIIPDEDTSILRGFIGAHWIVEEFRRDVEYVNAYFEKDIQPGLDIKEYGPDGKPVESAMSEGQKTEYTKNKVTLWQVWNIDDKSTFIIADGYKDMIQDVETESPSVKGFWKITPITFNDVEVEDGCRATIFPPSDVDLLRHPQIQTNRCRNSEARHRVANRPRAMISKGMLSEKDLDNIANSDDNQIVELEKVPPGTEPGKVLQPLMMTPFTEELYDTKKYQEDAQVAGGVQEANIGPVQSHVTATVGTIAEQSRVTVTSSDVDAQDDGLTDATQVGGEMLLKEMSKESVMRIAGPGAVWPEQNMQDYLNEIYLEVQAASSGRPNKAVELANLDKVIPLVMQAVQMPPQAFPTTLAIIKLVLQTLDSDLEASDFFPVQMPMMPEQQQQQQQGQLGQPQQNGQPPQPQRGGNGSGGPPHPKSPLGKRNKQPARPGQSQFATH